MLTTRPLDPDSGSQCTPHFALQKAVAAKVIGENCFEFILKATGVVTSPNYPDNYPNNLEETETIEVEQGLVLSLQFTAFDIEYSSSDCDYDHLTIMDGDGTNLMEKNCGTTLPADITSTSNMVKLVLSTDHTGTRTGYSVSWIAVTPGECQ